MRVRVGGKHHASATALVIGNSRAAAAGEEGEEEVLSTKEENTIKKVRVHLRVKEMCTERIDLQVREVKLHVNVVVEAQNELRHSAIGVSGGERIW